MTAMFSMEDLTTISEEPLILDELLGERLEFERPRKIRELIERNAAELQNYGEVCCIVQQTSDGGLPRDGANPSKGGRPGKAYYLNEDQAVLISMFSRTPKAAEVRKALITIYNEWRASHRTEPVQLPAPATVINVGGPTPAPGKPHEEHLTLRDKIAFITLTRQIHGQAAAQAMWPVMGLPEVRLGQTPEASAEKQAEALACFRRLLGRRLGSVSDDGEIETVFSAIRDALEGDYDSLQIVKEYGCRLLDDGEGGNASDETVLWVANHAPMLTKTYAETPWADRWMLHLKNLPGAVGGGKAYKTQGTLSRGTYIPLDTLALARPNADQTWQPGRYASEERRQRAEEHSFRQA